LSSPWSEERGSFRSLSHCSCLDNRAQRLRWDRTQSPKTGSVVGMRQCPCWRANSCTSANLASQAASAVMEDADAADAEAADADAVVELLDDNGTTAAASFLMGFLRRRPRLRPLDLFVVAQMVASCTSYGDGRNILPEMEELEYCRSARGCGSVLDAARSSGMDYTISTPTSAAASALRSLTTPSTFAMVHNKDFLNTPTTFGR
jgi:hypothetical protein